MESAFEDTRPYVLTELGKQFVHYTMNEIVPRLAKPRVPALDSIMLQRTIASCCSAPAAEQER